MRALVPLLVLAACGPTYPEDPRLTSGPDRLGEVNIPRDLAASRGISMDADTSDAIDRMMLRYLKTSDLPGASVAVVKGGRIVHTAGYGFADVASERAFEPTTPVMLASISKTFLGVATARLVEQEVVSVDAALIDHLDFEIDNPTHADDVTLRQALNHTAGLFDSENYYGRIEPGDPELSLHDYVASYLQDDGEFYGPENFTEQGPGATGVYANLSAGVAAVALETSTGVPFGELVTQEVLEPAGMLHTVPPV